MQPGAGRCEVCGKLLAFIGYSRCSAHATIPPIGWNEPAMQGRTIRSVDLADDVEENRRAWGA